jgi:PAS domain S-box-containing protein
MTSKPARQLQLIATQWVIGSGVLALVTVVGFKLHIDAPTAALIYLSVLVLVSLWATVVPALATAVAAMLCLDYFFTPPLFRIRIEQTVDVVAVITFAGAALVITRLRSVTRQSVEVIRGLKNEIELVVDTIPALAWSARPDGSRDFVSRRWLEYTGVAEKGGLGWGWTDTLHPEDRAGYMEQWKGAMAAGEPLEVETRLRRADAVYEWFLIRAVPLRDANGRIARWYGTATDIEDRKRAERLLAGEKRILETIARGASLPVTLDGLCRFVEQLSGDHLASILLLDSDGIRLRHGAAPNLPRAYVEAIDGLTIGPARGSCGTAAYRRKSVIVSDITTDPLWVDFRELASTHGFRACWSTPIVSTDQRVLGTFAMYAREPWSPTPYQRDLVEQITHLASIAIERRQAEDVLEHHVRLLDLTHDTIFVRDANTNVITFWNRGAEELYGWTREEAVGRVTHDLLKTVFPAPLEEIGAQLQRTGRWEGEMVHTTRSGTQVIVASRWSLQPDESEGRILETNNDITGRRHAEDAARRAQEELTHAARVATMGELSASIAHEVNQPLSGVVINANASLRWLAGPSPNLEEARDALQRIIRDGKRASDVIARVRALSRKDVTERERLDLNEIIRAVVALAQGELRKNRVMLKTQLADHLPAVLGDRIQLQQVVLNLMMNAIEAMSVVSDRPRELAISTYGEGEQVRVTVQDSGTGLDPQAMGRIFDAFYTTKHSGLGMGLSISRSIVDNHGGKLWAVPNEGPGTTFQFTV